MLTVKIDADNRIVTFEPKGPLSERDFQSAALEVDAVIEKSGRLNGIIIYTESFPGWESFAALCSHLRFVKDHHRSVSRVALVTDSWVGNLAESLASHFVEAEIRHFPFAELAQAHQWVLGEGGK